MHLVAKSRLTFAHALEASLLRSWLLSQVGLHFIVEYLSHLSASANLLLENEHVWWWPNVWVKVTIT